MGFNNLNKLFCHFLVARPGGGGGGGGEEFGQNGGMMMGTLMGDGGAAGPLDGLFGPPQQPPPLMGKRPQHQQQQFPPPRFFWWSIDQISLFSVNSSEKLRKTKREDNESDISTRDQSTISPCPPYSCCFWLFYTKTHNLTVLISLFAFE